MKLHHSTSGYKYFLIAVNVGKQNRIRASQNLRSIKIILMIVITIVVGLAMTMDESF